MAKYKAKYDSKDKIPAEIVDLFKLKDGVWEFDADEFDEFDEVVAPGLATNKNRILDEKRVLNDELKTVKTERDTAKAELEKVQKPGMKVITSDEVQTFEAYKKFGPVKDIENALAKKTELEGEITQTKKQKEIEDIATAAGADKTALTDWINSRGEGAKISTKTVKSKDSKGKDVEEVQIVVTYEEKDGAVTKTREKTLQEYAKEKETPDYLINAIFSSNKAATTGKQELKKRVHVPDLSKTSSNEASKGASASEIASRFNANRSTRQMPWSIPKEKEE